MVELQSLEDKLKKDPIWTDHRIFFGFGANKYDTGYKRVEEEFDMSVDLD